MDSRHALERTVHVTSGKGRADSPRLQEMGAFASFHPSPLSRLNWLCPLTKRRRGFRRNPQPHQQRPLGRFFIAPPLIPPFWLR